MKKILFLFVAIFIVTTSAMAQVFTTSPAILQENSSNVVITFHADQQSVTELQGLSASTGLYAHIGVFTTKAQAHGLMLRPIGMKIPQQTNSLMFQKTHGL